MWQKACAVLVGLVAVLAFGWVSAQEPSSGWSSGASYILKAGDCVSWPSGHPWYLRITSTSNYPFKVTTTNASGRAICAKAPLGGYAVYADGRMAAKSLKYTTPRRHLLSVGSAAFAPDMNLAYSRAMGPGGAYVDAPGTPTMSASVNLPDGAVVTNFKVFMENNSSIGYLLMRLEREGRGTGGFNQMAYVESTGISGYGSASTSTILNPTVDNSRYGYFVSGMGSTWDPPNLKIKGALITYTIHEAP
jgi:hypothetical protein